jgi:hypothetical protein
MPRIDFHVCVGIRAPIDPGSYAVRDKTDHVSYPTAMMLGNIPIELPKSLSTLFIVSWLDPEGCAARMLEAKSYHRHLLIHDVVEVISAVLLAFKLVRIGRSDACGIRTIDAGDTLFHTAFIDGKQARMLNVGLKNYPETSAWTSSAAISTAAVSSEAAPHVGTATLPLARRFVRCFELLEHGYYSEAFIIAFGLLDDYVQPALAQTLATRGVEEPQSFLRGIKENRLRHYLGRLLKLSTGFDLSERWTDGPSAIEWLNNTRNRIAHAAERVDYSSEARGIYASLKVVVTLSQNGVGSAEIPVELFRLAKLTAAWTAESPSWVPTGEIAESMDFRS